MTIIQSCCCWRSLRKGCYAAALYTLVYYIITIVTMGHFIEMEQRYLNGELVEPESESFLEPDKITHTTVTFNITLLACSIMGVISCALLVIAVYKDIKYLLCPWIFTMGLETVVEFANLLYLFYLQTPLHRHPLEFGLLALLFIALSVFCLLVSLIHNFRFSYINFQMNFNPITAFLFTLDFFIIALNVYALVCVISQLQEYINGRGTAAFDSNDRMAAVQYTATAQQTTTTSSAPSGRRRSAGRPMPSRCEPEEFSEAPTKAMTSVLSKPSRSNIKKHVQFPDEQSCIEEGCEPPLSETIEEKSEGRVISSLWMELESEAPPPDR